MRGKNQRKAQLARSLRGTLTPAEAAFWSRVRNRQLGGFKFVRQEPIGSYYVDFVCREQRPIVELDGGQHAESIADRKRDADPAALGDSVLRIWNNEIIENIDGVLEMMLSELRR